MNLLNRVVAACVVLTFSGVNLHASDSETAQASAKEGADMTFEAVAEAWKNWRKQPLDPIATMYATLGAWQDYPGDPRAWNPSQMNNIVFLGETEGKTEEKIEAYEQSLRRRIATMRADSRLSDQQIAQLTVLDARVMTTRIYAEIGELRGSEVPVPVETLWRLRDELQGVAQVHPDSEILRLAVIAFLRIADDAQPQVALEISETLARSNAPSVREAAAGKLNILKGRERPVSLAFESLDGRQVNLDQMRGKVVLVDFWATWCVPCVAEMPNVRAVYEKYRKKGFEVVGVTLDTNRKATEDFLKEKKLPWPNYFDGKGWQNKFARQFSIASLPTILLIDANGYVVFAGPRFGPETSLEQEVARLLGT